MSSVTKQILHSKGLSLHKPSSQVEHSRTTAGSDDEREDFQVASTSKSSHLET